MRTLVRSVGRESIGGEPLPSPFKAFDKASIAIRRSELTMVAATPGAGKSMLALAVALRAKVPTLYISADTNAHTMAMRMASMITNKPQGEVERLLNNDIGWTKAVLAHGSHIHWSFESSPSLEDIAEEVKSFEELWGQSPELIVVDNLMDVATDGGEEFSSMRAIMKELKYLARATNAAILVLHHTSEGIQGNPCQPRSALQGKVAQLPALILTLGLVGTTLAIAVVKNRYGAADANGTSVMTWLAFNGEYCYVNDIPENA